MGDLLTPEKLTLIGVLALAVVAFTRGWVVRSTELKAAQEETKTAKADCKFWQDKCLEAWGVAGQAAVTTRKVTELARTVVKQAEANDGDSKPRMEGQL